MRTLALPTLLVALLGAWLLWPTPPEPAPEAAGLRFPAGQRLHYRFEHTNTQRVVPMADAPPIEAQADLAADLELRGLGQADGLWQFALSFKHFDRAVLRVGAQDALGDPAALQGLEAVVELRADGEIHSVRFPEGSPHTFQNLVHLVVSEIQVRLSEGVVQETTQHGVARSRYTPVGPAAGPIHITRERTTYERLQATPTGPAEVAGTAEALVTDGHLVRLDAKEHLRAGPPTHLALEARSTTRLVLVATDHDARPAPITGRRVALGAPARAPDHAERALADRVQGLTPQALLEMLQGARQSGQLPHHNQSLWRAVGLLRADDALCAELGALAGEEGLSSAGRGLVLDLLASAGTPAAQAALRSALSADRVRADPKFPLLFQRLSLISLPDSATLEFLEQAYAAPGAETLGAAAFALGAAAGQTARAGDAQGRALADRLLHDLEEAETPDHQALRLIALGNAGLPEHLDALLAYTRAEHPEVRRAAAAALRKLDDPRAREALLDLAGDAEARVQRRALDALARRGAAEHEVNRLGDLGATVAESNLDAWVSLLLPFAHTPEGQAALRSVLARELRDARIKGRIRAVLGEG
jgi:HEAT repeat protein